MADDLDPRHEDALRRIIQADTAIGRVGGDSEEFTLYYSGEGPEVLHGGWDRSWAPPTAQTIDDLGEMGLLRVGDSGGRGRKFSLSLSGRRRAEDLAPQLNRPSGAAERDGSMAAELELSIDAFLARIGLDLFTPGDLADAVPNPKFDTRDAALWLRGASNEGRVTSVSGQWQVGEGAETPSFHVRMAPVNARDLLGGPIYAFDLSEADAIQRFVAPFKESEPVAFGDRTFSEYRKPKITRLYGSGTETVEKIRQRLAKSRRVHAANEAEELFFKSASQDVTDTYIGHDEPDAVRAGDGPGSAPPDTTVQAVPPAEDDAQAKEIFVVHGHQRKDEVAGFLQRTTGIEPIVLGERAGRGRTIIEKFEGEARAAAYAVVLLTEDDLGRAKDAADLRPRARQNVILELGYFIGKIGRENVAVLHEDDVEILTDYQGVEYISFAGNWEAKLIRELREAGIPIVPGGV
ncbi:MAG: hypothetical protein QOE56_2657 [Solirubrobacterales bacterium]|jgi:hypothetical protein|nr:hypothetical protein [Solirubrobacterales bacterium]